MTKIKSIRQALSKMKTLFPGVYVNASIAMHSYSDGSLANKKRVYSEEPRTPGENYGISGEGESWDEAFIKVAKNAKEVRRQINDEKTSN